MIYNIYIYIFICMIYITKLNCPKIAEETSSSSTNVFNNIGKYFPLLTEKHFPNNR